MPRVLRGYEAEAVGRDSTHEGHERTKRAPSRVGNLRAGVGMAFDIRLRTIRAARGPVRTARSWAMETPLRVLMNDEPETGAPSSSYVPTWSRTKVHRSRT